MKKVLFGFWIVALVALISSVTVASTRTLTMGDNNMILLDEDNIFLFPSRIYEWPNLAVADFGDQDFNRFGLHWKFGSKDKTTYLATYFHNNSVAVPIMENSPFFNDKYNLGFTYGYNGRYIPFDKSLLSNQRVDIVYGRKHGKNQVGFQFGILNSSQKNDIPNLVVPNDAKDRESYTVYSLNSGITLNDGKVDLAFGLDLMSFEDFETGIDAGFDETKSKGNYMVHFSGRTFRMKTKQYTLIPHFMINYGKFEADYFELAGSDVNLVESDKYTRSNVDLGVGVQYTPGGDVLAVLDFGFIYDKLNGDFKSATDAPAEATVKTLSLPYFKIGFDAAVFKWMDIRMGATSYWKKESWQNNTTNSEHNRNFADNNTYLGFGFHWNNLHIDTWTDPDLFLRGFDFINGKEQTTHDMNFGIRAVYEM